MASQNNAMETLRSHLNSIQGSQHANNARIKAALLMAIIDGADTDEIIRMGRAVFLHVSNADV